MDSLVQNKNVEGNEEITKALEGETVEGLLGKPIWCNETLPEAAFTSLAQFEAELAAWTQVIQQHLTEHDFNTFGDYVHFYGDYTQLASTQKPIDFYRDYEAKIKFEYMNCTGLSRTLLKSLQQSNPEFGSNFALVSSDESSPVSSSNSSKKYHRESATVPHVLICFKFALSQSDRKGCVLFDSSYSVTRPIVVMHDSAYPHTGWFVRYRKPQSIEQRHYTFVNDQFIQYELRYINAVTGQIEREPHINSIYVEKEYLSYESVTQKRSLVKQVHYWVIRNSQGVVAGIGAFIDKRSLLIRYQQPNDSTQVLQHFSLDELDSEPVHRALRMVAQCSAQSRSAIDQSSAIEHNFQMYLRTLQQFRKVLDDKHFTRDMRAVYNWISAEQQPIDQLSTIIHDK